MERNIPYYLCYKNGKRFYLDKGENVCIIFMDFSKASDTISHDLLLAELKAYGFSENALKLNRSCLRDR